MTKFQMLTEMVSIDGFLYKTICDVVGGENETSTETVYKIFETINKQKTWKVADIEQEFKRYGKTERL